MLRLMLFLIFIGGGSSMLFAQQTYTVKLTDAKTGNPITNASILEKSTNRGTTSNDDGVFKILSRPGEVLVITSVGYKPQSVKLSSASEIAVTLTASSLDLGDVVVVGSRGAPRSKTESPVPVDIIKVNAVGETTAKPDLMSQLNMAVPSFNYNKQSGADGSDAIDFASLRGLGFDQTLVLVNGKRRHLSAFVNEVGTRGRGNSGTDLNSIPEASIDHIEILRDGASAQYGSDAIAGVINIVLKKDVKHFNLTIGQSGYYDHKYNSLNNVDPSQYYTGTQIDGKTFNVAADYGLPLGKHGGFINLGGNFMNQGKTFRELPDTNVNTNFNNQMAAPIDAWRRASGDGSVTSGGVMYNIELPIAGTRATFYSFGGVNLKHSNVYAWTRRWANSGNHIKFPTDNNGNLVFVPGIMRVYDPTPGVLDTGHVYYNPQEDVYLKDYSAAFGIKGKMGKGWDWDLSNTTGYNDFHYWGNQTFNASLPYPTCYTKTRFDDGGFNYLQNTANFDMTKRVNSFAKGMTMSFGAEFRFEKYNLYAGEPDSYRNGGATLKGVAKASGSEGYPGYQPADASTSNRSNLSAYADFAIDITKNWMVDLAARVENYSDFGSVATGKIATLYKLADNFNLRGSLSNGFRAPSLMQMNFSNTNTNIIGGQLVYQKLVPNYSNIAQAAGIPQLKPEYATNASFGFTWKPSRKFTITTDFYNIAIRDRIVISGTYYQGDPVLGTTLNNLLTTQAVGAAQFFTNAVNTTNTGLDIVLDYNTKIGTNGRFKASLAGNIQKLMINKINVPTRFNDHGADSAAFFSDREQWFLKASAPKAKFSLNLEYSVRKITVGTHLTYYGDVKTLGYGETNTPASAADAYFPYVALDANQNQAVPEIFDFKAKLVTDIYLMAKLNKTVSFTIGVDNLFNVHPNTAVTTGSVGAFGNGGSSWGDSESGGAWDSVQMGSNGLRMFGKISFNF